MTNEYPWMKEADRRKEQAVLQILERTDITSLEKAKLLGFKKTTANIDGKRTTGYVDVAMHLFTSLNNLIEHHKKYPMGFDYYYWGNEYHKTQESSDI